MVENLCKYDARMDWSVSNKCNFQCAYCINPNKDFISNNLEKPSRIDIEKAVEAINKTKKTFLINITGGGEPFFVPNLIDFCEQISKNHFISITSNLVLMDAEEFCKKINPNKVYFIIASTHLKELEKSKFIDKFVKNFLKLKKNGFNISAVEIAYPPLKKDLKKYKDYLKEKGIELTFNPFFGFYNNKKYPDSYTDKEIKLFGLNPLCRDSYNTKFRLCNAGYNYIQAYTNGDIYYCTILPKSLGNLYNEVIFNKKLIKCPVET